MTHTPINVPPNPTQSIPPILTQNPVPEPNHSPLTSSANGGLENILNSLSSMEKNLSKSVCLLNEQTIERLDTIENTENLRFQQLKAIESKLTELEKMPVMKPFIQYPPECVCILRNVPWFINQKTSTENRMSLARGVQKMFAEINMNIQIIQVFRLGKAKNPPVKLVTSMADQPLIRNAVIRNHISKRWRITYEPEVPPQQRDHRIQANSIAFLLRKKYGYKTKGMPTRNGFKLLYKAPAEKNWYELNPNMSKWNEWLQESNEAKNCMRQNTPTQQSRKFFHQFQKKSKSILESPGKKALKTFKRQPLRIHPERHNPISWPSLLVPKKQQSTKGDYHDENQLEKSYNGIQTHFPPPNHPSYSLVASRKCQLFQNNVINNQKTNFNHLIHQCA